MLRRIAEAVKKYGGRMFYVGGYVRDRLLGTENKDIDVEVYGIAPEKFLEILSKFGAVNTVGKSFGILKVKGLDADFAMPRRERKIGSKHTDFEVSVDPFMPYEEACRRRDFTINSILEDVLTGEIIDPFDGRNDLAKKIIRHIDDSTFQEDALRVYRAFQFAARFGFTIAPATLELIKRMLEELKLLPKERLFEEFRKLLLKSPKPSVGFEYMRETGVLEFMHPLLYQMVGCDQSPDHHPEGSVWNHTMLTVDVAASLKGSSKDPEAFMFAALLHDIGKPYTREIKDDRIRFPGHEEKGVEIARDFMLTLTNEKKLIDRVCLLVREHMTPYNLYLGNAKAPALRRFANRVGNINDVLLLAEADHKGRAIQEDFPVRKWFEEKNPGTCLEPGNKAYCHGEGSD